MAEATECEGLRGAGVDVRQLTPVRLRSSRPTAASSGQWKASGFFQGRIRARHIHSVASAPQPRSPAEAPAPPAHPRGPGVRPGRTLRPFSASSSSGPRKDQGPHLLLEVSEAEEALVCYRQAADQGAAADRLEPAVRAPLLLATAAQAPDAGDVVRVTLATPSDLACLGRMQAAPGEAHSRFRGQPVLPEESSGGGGGPQQLELEVPGGGEAGARRVLAQLSAAGCVLQGLAGRFRLRKEVGRGGFGRVYLAHDTWDGKEVAMKLFFGRRKREFHPLRESTVLRWARDPLFPQFKAVYRVLDEEFEDFCLEEDEGPHSFVLVTEYLPGGELFALLERTGPLPEDCARAVMRQLFRGLDSLHKQGLMHRDIKPENVMLAGFGNQVKLVDFGLACPEWDEEASVARVGSIGYVAPEVLAQSSPHSPPQSTKVDCYGAGLLLYTCLAGHGPFRGANVKEVLVKNLHNSVNQGGLARLPEGAADLVRRLLVSLPAQRPTAEQCLRHPWLAPAGDTIDRTHSSSSSLDPRCCGASSAAWRPTEAPCTPLPRSASSSSSRSGFSSMSLSEQVLIPGTKSTRASDPGTDSEPLRFGGEDCPAERAAAAAEDGEPLRLAGEGRPARRAVGDAGGHAAAGGLGPAEADGAAHGAGGRGGLARGSGSLAARALRVRRRGRADGGPPELLTEPSADSLEDGDRGPEEHDALLEQPPDRQAPGPGAPPAHPRRPRGCRGEGGGPAAPAEGGGGGPAGPPASWLRGRLLRAHAQRPPLPPPGRAEPGPAAASPDPPSVFLAAPARAAPG